MTTDRRLHLLQTVYLGFILGVLIAAGNATTSHHEATRAIIYERCEVRE